VKTNAIFPSWDGRKLERFNNRVDPKLIQGITTVDTSVKALYVDNTLMWVKSTLFFISSISYCILLTLHYFVEILSIHYLSRWWAERCYIF